jgi:hypothetical protein
LVKLCQDGEIQTDFCGFIENFAEGNDRIGEGIVYQEQSSPQRLTINLPQFDFEKQYRKFEVQFVLDQGKRKKKSKKSTKAHFPHVFRYFGNFSLIFLENG